MFTRKNQLLDVWSEAQQQDVTSCSREFLSLETGFESRVESIQQNDLSWRRREFWRGTSEPKATRGWSDIDTRLDDMAERSWRAGVWERCNYDEGGRCEKNGELQQAIRNRFSDVLEAIEVNLSPLCHRQAVGPVCIQQYIASFRQQPLGEVCLPTDWIVKHIDCPWMIVTTDFTLVLQQIALVLVSTVRRCSRVRSQRLAISNLRYVLILSTALITPDS